MAHFTENINPKECHTIYEIPKKSASKVAFPFYCNCLGCMHMIYQLLVILTLYSNHA